MKHKRITNGWLYWLLVALAILLFSCSKQDVIAQPKSADVYTLVIEHYTLDTVFVNRYIQWRDTVFIDKEKKKIESTPGKWYLMCATDRLPLRLEYWYYLKNGIRIK